MSPFLSLSIYIYIYGCLSLSLYIFINVYTYVYVCMYVYMYIYIYTYMCLCEDHVAGGKRVHRDRLDAEQPHGLRTPSIRHVCACICECECICIRIRIRVIMYMYMRSIHTTRREPKVPASSSQAACVPSRRLLRVHCNILYYNILYYITIHIL